MQRAWIETDVVQYCQPGQIMAAAALLQAKPKPSDAEIDAALCGQSLPLWNLPANPRSSASGLGAGACGRKPVPIPRAEFVAKFKQCVEAGAPCP